MQPRGVKSNLLCGNGGAGGTAVYLSYRFPGFCATCAVASAIFSLTRIKNTPLPRSSIPMPSFSQSAAIAAGNSFGGIGLLPLASHAST